MQPTRSRDDDDGASGPSRPPLICVSGHDRKISCFHAETLKLMHEVRTPQDSTRIVAIPASESDDDVLVAVSESDPPYETYLVNPRTKKLVRKLQATHTKEIMGLASLSPSLVVSGDDDSHVYVSNVRTGKKVLTLKGPPKWTRRIVCGNYTIRGGRRQEDEQVIFVSGGNKRDNRKGLPIRFYDLKCKRPTKVMKKFVGHTDEVCGMSYSSSDGFLVSTSHDETVRIWSLQDESEAQSGSLSEPSFSVYYEPESHLAFCGLQGIKGGSIEVCDIRNLSQSVRTFQPHPGRFAVVHDIIPTVPGKYVSIDSRNHSVSLWNSEGKIIATAVTGFDNYGVCCIDPQLATGEEPPVLPQPASDCPPPGFAAPAFSDDPLRLYQPVADEREGVHAPPFVAGYVVKSKDPLMAFLVKLGLEKFHSAFVENHVTFADLPLFLKEGGGEVLDSIIPGQKFVQFKLIQAVKDLATQ